MRILVFLYEIDKVGGTEIATRQLAHQFVKRGHQTVLLGTQAMRHFLRGTPVIENENGLRIIRLPVWQRSTITFRRMLTAEAVAAIPLFADGFDILITRGVNRNSAIIANIAKRWGMKSICVVQGSGQYGEFGQRGIDIRADEVPFNSIVCLTEDSQREVIQWGYPAKQTIIIGNGVDTEFFYPDPSIQNKKGVLFVGRFREEKRIDLLLQAWAIASKTYPDFQLTLVGGGEKQPYYEAMAQELNIDVTFLPAVPRETVADLLRQNGFFVLPSTSEGMSNALLEAMACGLVPVVSDIPGNRAVVTHEHNGILFESGSVESLAQAFMAAFAQPDQIEILAQNAFSTIQTQYTVTHAIEQYEDLIRKLIY